MCVALQPAAVCLLDCQTWCRGTHDEGNPPYAHHYAPEPVQIRLSTEQPDPLCEFGTIDARRRMIGGRDQIALTIHGIANQVVLTPAEARQRRAQLDPAVEGRCK